jgi:hypothetical protein
MGLSKWLKKQATAISLAFSNVEKNALGQTGGNLEENNATHHKVNKNTLSQDLLRGELTQQVKEIRWRTYKVIQEAAKWSTTVTPQYANGIKQVPIYNEEGEIVNYELGEVTATTVSNQFFGGDKYETALKNLMVDPEDDYKPEFCIKNDDVAKSVVDTMGADGLEIYDEAKVIKDDEGNVIQVSHGELKSEYHSASDYNKPILIERELRPRIELERFTKKLIVRTISEEEKLLEFYISKYPDEYDKRTSLVVSECKKIKDTGRRSDMTDINRVGFITLDDIAVPDYLQFEYDIIAFDKIIEFEGSYVLKFKAKPTVNGDNILAEFIDEELEERYKNNEPRKI